MEKLLYSVEEAGELLSFKRSKMWQFISQGRIRAVKVGKATRIPADELHAFVSKVKADATVQAVG